MGCGLRRGVFERENLTYFEKGIGREVRVRGEGWMSM